MHHDELSGSSTGTSLTADSNERIEELQESLKELGFSVDDSRRKREEFRRHSSKMGADEFISAMLEVASEDSSSSPDESSTEDLVTSCGAQTSRAPVIISAIAEVTEADKRVQALNDSLLELGYCQEHIIERQSSYRQLSNTIKP